MKATELRIGNWIQSIKFDCYSEIENGQDIDRAINLNCEPIPLTEGWTRLVGEWVITTRL